VTWTEKSRLRLDAGEIAFVDAGDPEAPAVVLLSGGLTSSYLWRQLIPMLSPFMRVIAPDLLGSGESESPEGADLGLRAHAATVRALLDSLGVERFALAGHGRGGGVAQLVAVEGDAAALILIDSVAFDGWPSKTILDMRERLHDVDDAFVRSWFETLFERGMRHRERMSDADLDEFRRPFEGPDGVERFVRVAMDLDGEGLVGIEPRLEALEIPAFVLWGEDDAFLPAELAERLGDALPMASVALLPGCGHFLLEDAADTVVPLIFQWLRRMYLGVPHGHEEGPVTVQLGRRPPEDDRW
jgi:pimeloyl-ACP methyl ester carboxylesterase